MNLKRFEDSRRGEWRELERLVGISDPRQLGPSGVRRRAQLYRSAAADLAYARNHYPHDVVVDELESLVSTARTAVYRSSTERSGSVRTYLWTGYWQDLWARRWILVAAGVFFLASGAFGSYVAIANPDGATVLVPEAFLWITEAESTDQELGAADLAGFSLFVLTNNIRVTVFSFVLGISFGLLTATLLAYNGVVFGAIATLATQAGNGEVALEAVIGHGLLELSCIVVGSAAGLSLGWRMLKRGNLRLGEAIRQESAVAFKIALGTAPWLILAGILEGFLSRTGTDWVPATVIGVTAAGIYWGLFLWRGPIPTDSSDDEAGVRPVRVVRSTSR